ncbi:AfsA-related hotdog domain-containing protein [Nocardia sp. NPDC051321]|uniref:AfsA-related hotdog domain-containing protein n=1 Tax=Nocardia sp. NPDC051321 TaxID=3364323 RepID=UPI0037BB0F31
MVSTRLEHRILDRFGTADRGVAELRKLVDHRQTVPRELTHRRSVSEVFVCDRTRIAPELFVIAVQLPRAHSLWADGHYEYHDTLLAAEAVRQAAIMSGHDFFEIAPETIMVARSFDMAVLNPDAFHDDRRNPLEGVLLFALTPLNGAEGPSGLTFETVLLIGDAPAMTMSGSLMFAAESDFALVRAMSRAQLGNRAEHAVTVGEVPAPELVGRDSARHVAIRAVAEPAGIDRISVLVDLDNAAFFDHPLDHVPGQLITEAVRQAATWNLSRTRGADRAGGVPMVTRGRAAFDGFAELDVPAELELIVKALDAADTYQVDATVVQSSKQIGTVAMEVEFRSDAGRIANGERS